MSVWFKEWQDRVRRERRRASFIDYALLIGLVLDAGTDHFSHLPVSGRLHFFFSLKGIVGVLLGGRGDGKSFVRGGTPRSERGIRAARITLAT